jgi:hypothetical protein
VWARRLWADDAYDAIRDCTLIAAEADAELARLRAELAAVTAERDALRVALAVAADALHIAADFNLPAVQAEPPLEWGLDGGGEDPAEGWCCTRGLANKLSRLANPDKFDAIDAAAAELAVAEARYAVPPCLECGAVDRKDAERKCIVGGDKDDCHGCSLWPD